MQPFLNFLIDIKDAKFGFDVIGKAIADMYNAIVANPTIQMIWNGMMNLFGRVFCYRLYRSCGLLCRSCLPWQKDDGIP